MEQVKARTSDGALIVPALATAMVLLLAAGWLLSGTLVEGASPLAVAVGRTASSFVAITAVAVLRPSTRSAIRVGFRRPRAVLVLAFLGFFAYYAGTLFGVDRIGASRVGVIVSLLPCITFMIGVVAYGERLSVARVLGTLTAVSAAVVYALYGGSGSSADDGSGPRDLLIGVLLALVGTAAYAWYGYVYRQRMLDSSPAAALPGITGAGAVMLGVVALPLGALSGVAPAEWLGITLLGVVFTAPVFLLSHALILRKGPLFTSSVALVVPFLIRLGEWCLGRADRPGPLVLVLLVLCAVGVSATVRGRPRTDGVRQTGPSSTAAESGQTTQQPRRPTGSGTR